MKRPILILTTSFPRFEGDDAGIFIYRLACALSRSGCDGTVIVPRDVETESLNTAERFSIQRVSYGIFARGALAFGAGIVPNIKKSPLRLLQIPTLLAAMTRAAMRPVGDQQPVICAQWIFAGLAAWFAALANGAPYTITIRGEDFRLLKILPLRLLLLPALRRAAAIITVSRSFESELKKMSGVPAGRVVLIENGVERGTVEPAPAPLPAENFLLFVGTVIPRKRIDLLCELIAATELQSYTLVICGRLDNQDEHRRLMNRAAELGVKERVLFQGAVSPERAAYLMAHARAYVSASEFEGRPNAVLEALAAGKVTALSRIAAHQEIVADEENGLLFSQGDMRGAAQRLAHTLNDAAVCQSLTAAAKKSVAELSWERAAEKYKEILFR